MWWTTKNFRCSIKRHWLVQGYGRAEKFLRTLGFAYTMFPARTHMRAILTLMCSGMFCVLLYLLYRKMIRLQRSAYRTCFVNT